MKKKFLTLPVAALTAITCAFGIAGCASSPDSGNEQGGGNTDGNVGGNTHSHVFDKEVAEEKFLKSAADSKHCAVYYYSCECGEKGTETFERGEALQPSQGLTYTINLQGTECTVTGISVTIDGALVIPHEKDGIPVTGITERAFNSTDCKFTSISIPDSVKSIAENAFTVSNLVTAITVSEGNPNYKSVNNCLLTKDGKELVLGCQTSVIPDGVTKIGNNAFYNCGECKNINIPEGITSIGDWAFFSCVGLTSLAIPASVTSIGDYAFTSCRSVASITVAEGNANYKSDGNCLLTKDGKNLITGCKTSVIPAGVTTICAWAFYTCNGLESIKIPDGVTSICARAFESCQKLASVTIPKSVTSIDSHAFDRCRKLTTITFEGTKDEWKAVEKGEDWNFVSTVQCSDGKLDSKGSEIE